MSDEIKAAARRLKRSLERESQLRQLSRDYLYETAPGVHTYHACSCGRGRTRRGECHRCVLDAILNIGALEEQDASS